MSTERTIEFYTRPLRPCDCGKPVTTEIMATGGMTYDFTCDKCAPKKVRELDKRHNRPDPPTRERAR